MAVLRFLLVLLTLLTVLTGGPASAAPGQRLPSGQLNRDGERSVDILHYRAEVRIDFDELRVQGQALLKARPLRRLDTLSLDAVGLDVLRVSLEGEEEDLSFTTAPGSLQIKLPRPATSDDTLSLRIVYECTPRAGMYFQRDPRNPQLYVVHTYGEGGLHANWLPIYSDVNDKFTSEILAVVPRTYVAISNGEWVDTFEFPDGQMGYHWRQDRPHSTYLISLYVGDFEQGTLTPALGSVPLSYWVPRGRLAEGAWVFRNTTRMVEFFSRRFDYPYPWVKYDQIAVPDYAVGAMEHTGVTGHNASVLRHPRGAPADFGAPIFSEYTSDWTAEATIAHELAHHWFGNNVTCRNLSYIWLNESFASYLMMLWDEESLGEEQLLFDVDLARRHYLEYVAQTHIIRPLEYPYFDSPDEIYNLEHTYLKGAAVLHMLRRILGDAGFFRSLSHYLRKHEFANVVSQDLRIAIQESTGRNLDWFFDQWVTGGGHPRFEVGYRYLEDRGVVDLRVDQVQPLVEGQGLFRLPVDVVVEVPDRTWHHTLWVEGATQSFLLPSPEAPLMVSFDGEGSLVMEVAFPKGPGELAYQAENDGLAGRLRALRQLAENYPRQPETLHQLTRTLAKATFWGLRAEAVFLLGGLGTPQAEDAAERALSAPDYRVRKAAVLALGELATPSALTTLEDVVRNEPHSDVVATAIVALAQAGPDPGPDLIRLLEAQLARDSWYDEIRMATVDAFAVLQKPELVPVIKPYTASPYNQDLRQAAVAAWEAAAPTDPELHATLLKMMDTPPYPLQQYAAEALGRLYVQEAAPKLTEWVEADFDPNLTLLARRALAEIRRVHGE